MDIYLPSNAGFPWGEFWAAGFGAGTAFALGALREWRSRIASQKLAVNRAVGVFAQMYGQLRTLKLQIYDSARSEIQAKHHREPVVLEIPPVSSLFVPSARFDFEALAFLIDSHEPDIPNILSVHQDRYVQHLTQENLRSKLHVEVQRRMAAAGLGEGARLDMAAARQIAGQDLIAQLEAVTLFQVEHLQSTLDDFVKGQESLFNVAQIHFPTGRFMKFVPELTDAVATQRRNPPILKVWIRAIVDRARKGRLIKLNR